MNNWTGIGRLTKDVELRYTGDQMSVARFSLGIVDGYGEKKKTNFIPVVVFGKQAESCEKFLAKGRMVAVEGKIQTGSYDKDGQKVYTTDVIANRVEFIDWAEKNEQKPKEEPSGFSQIDEDIPF